MKKFAVTYSVVIQFFVNEIVLIALGYFIGTKIDGKSGIWCGILAAVGAVLAMALFIAYALKIAGDDNARKRIFGRDKDGKSDDNQDSGDQGSN